MFTLATTITVSATTALVLGLLGLFFAIAGLSLKMSVGASKEVGILRGRVLVNETKIDGIQDELVRIRNSIESIEAKLDKVLGSG